MAFQDALETFPSNETKRWKSPDGSASGFVTPLRTFRIETGHYCREFLETVSTDQGLISSQGIACRTREGRWLGVDKDEKS
jgi:surface antigen